MISRILSVGLILISAMVFSACRGGTKYVYVSYGGSWYDVFGNKCAEGRPSPGCNFYANGSKIRDWEDPYFNAMTHTLMFNNNYIYRDSFQNMKTYSGWLWISPSGIAYDDFGFALNKSSQTESFDVVANAAEQESQLIQEAAQDLSDRHGLPLDRSIIVATSLKKMENKVSKTNVFTEEDSREYFASAYGISYESALSALTKARDGDLKELHERNGEVAKYWNVNKETAEETIRSWNKVLIEASDLKI
jgi:hypothetical protein